MLCPVCKIKLETAIFYGVEVDYCPKCLGFWLEEGELNSAKDYKDRNLRWLDIDLWKEAEKFKIARTKKICPVCRLPLYEVNYGTSKVKVDVCNLCRGLWLDRGEFKKIIQYLKRRADFEILNHYLKNLNEEFWEIFTGPEEFQEEVSDFLAVIKLLNYKLIFQYPAIAKIIAGLPK
jgi:Zn-finger nucleic acid-binding protein